MYPTRKDKAMYMAYNCSTLHLAPLQEWMFLNCQVPYMTRPVEMEELTEDVWPGILDFYTSKELLAQYIWEDLLDAWKARISKWKSRSSLVAQYPTQGYGMAVKLEHQQ